MSAEMAANGIRTHARTNQPGSWSNLLFLMSNLIFLILEAVIASLWDCLL